MTIPGRDTPDEELLEPEGRLDQGRLGGELNTEGPVLLGRGVDDPQLRHTFPHVLSASSAPNPAATVTRDVGRPFFVTPDLGPAEQILRRWEQDVLLGKVSPFDLPELPRSNVAVSPGSLNQFIEKQRTQARLRDSRRISFRQTAEKRRAAIIMTALLQHDPSLLTDADRLNALTTTLIDAEKVMPEIAAEFDRDLGNAIAMSTREWAALRALEAATGETGFLGQIIQGAQDIYLERTSAVHSAQQLLADQTMVRQNFNELTLDGFSYSGESTGLPGEIEELFREQVPVGTRTTAGTPVGATEIKRAFDDFKGKPGSWAWDRGRNLAIMVVGTDGSEHLALIRLDEGTQIRNTKEAMVAYMRAVTGSGHHLDATSEALPGRRTLAGATLKMFGDIGRWTERRPVGRHVWGALDAVADEILPGRVDAAHAAEFRAQTYADQARYVQDEYILAAAALSNYGPVASGAQAMDNLYRVYASSDIDLDQVRNDFLDVASQNSAAIIEAREEALEERGPFTRFVGDQVVPPLLTGLQMWDGFTQGLGLVILQGFGSVLGLDSDTLRKEFGDGWDLFRAAIDIDDPDRPMISDFFGVEGDAAVWVDLAGGIAFDPFVLASAGGKGAMTVFREAMSNPATATRYIRNHPRWRSVARNIAVKNDLRMVALFTDTMESPHIARLIRLAESEAATPDDVFKVFEDAISDTWLPHVPGRSITRQTALGIGGAISKWDALPSGAQEWLVRVMARGSRRRGVDITERGFLTEVFDMILWKNPTDSAAQARLMKEAVDEYEAWRAWTPERAASIAEDVRRLRKENLRMLGPHATHIDRFRKLIADIEKQQRFVDELDSAVRAGDVDAVAAERARAILDDKLAEAGRLQEQVGPVLDQSRATGREISRLRRQQAELAQPRDTGALARWIHKVYQEWGEEAGLKVAVDDLTGAPVRHPFLGTADEPVFMLDWSPITGDKRSLALQEESIRSFSPLAGDDPARLAQQDAIGMMSRRGQVPVPASPIEILAYQTSPKVWKKVRRSVAVEGARNFYQTLNSFWVLNLLMNPITSVRASLDEVLRYGEITGEFFKAFGAGVISAPGGGRLRAGLDRALGSWNPYDMSTWAKAWARETAEPVAARIRPWELIDNTDRKAYFEAAERWLNGHLLRDEHFAAYARAVRAGDRTIFYRYWETEGKHRARRATFRPVEGRPLPGAAGVQPGSLAPVEITAERAFDIIEDGFNHWLSRGTGGAELRDALLDAAATTRFLDPALRSNARLIRKGGPVAGQRLAGKRLSNPGGASRRMMDVLYGGPQARRGAIFFDHYFDEAMGILERRLEGRIIDTEFLVNRGLARNADEAESMIALGHLNAEIRQLAVDQGMYTRPMLEERAAAFAGKTADSMMYQLGAVSVAGKSASLLYPFGRAQIDFLDWWMRRLFAPLQFRTAGELGVATVKPLGGRSFVPLNARLASRWAHLTAATHHPELGDSRPGTFDAINTPGGWVEAMTFIPTKFDHRFHAQFIPSLGWLPSWLIEDGPVPAEVEDFLEDIHPYLAFNEGRSPAEILFPTSGRAVRGVAGPGLALLLQRTGVLSENDENFIRYLFDLDAEPPAFRAMAATGMAEWLQGGDIWNVTVDPVMDGFRNTPVADTLNTILGDARNRALQRDAVKSIQEWLPFADPVNGDFGWIDAYEPMIEALPIFTQLGFLADNQIDRITDGWEAWKNGDLDAEGARALADTLSDALFRDIPDEMQDWMIVTYGPQIAVNMVSRVECKSSAATGESLVPEEHRHLCAGGRFVSPDNEIRQQGFNEGWLGTRPHTEWAHDVVLRAHRAARSFLANVYPALTGVAWKRKTQKVAERTQVTIAEDQVIFLAEGLGVPVMDALERLGVIFPAEAFDPQTRTWTMTAAEVGELFQSRRENYAVQLFSIETPTMQKLRNRDGKRPDGTVDDTEFAMGKGLADQIEEFRRVAERDFGIDDPRDFPDTEKQKIRDALKSSMLVFNDGPDPFTEADWNRDLAWWLGPLDEFEPPPPVAELQDPLTGPADEVQVVDGDTVRLPSRDGWLTIRIIGLNAPEQGQQGYLEAWDELQNVLDSADTVTFGLFRPELYGVTSRFLQEGGTVSKRLNMWLYVDGVPLYDPDVFQFGNVRGTGIGGRVADLTSILDANRTPARIPEALG